MAAIICDATASFSFAIVAMMLGDPYISAKGILPIEL